MAGEEERVLECQLELQLHEQRDSLATLEEALKHDPTNAELLTVHEDLVLAIKDAEEGLLYLKRERLLLEADLALNIPEGSAQDVKVEPLVSTEVRPESLEAPCYSVGSKCRFRYTNGRWYNGQIIGIDSSSAAKVSFLTPTIESMMMCKFFLQQRCRFGTNCRFSHGVNVPVSSLKIFVPMSWEQSLVGSSIWAIANSKAGIWREAELETWDNMLNEGQVVFRDDGTSAKLGPSSLTRSEYATMTDDEESESISEESESSTDDDDDSLGLGILGSTALQKGIQTDTILFAEWENHTRGIASKMMAGMGYREGSGLGAAGQGIVNPISVKLLPPKPSLGHEQTGIEVGGKMKKRSRGGKRKRDKLLAAASRAARAEAEPDVFSLINRHLAMCGQPGKSEVDKAGKEEDRRSLVGYDDEVRELRGRVERLEEMVGRNRKEKAVFEAAMRKLGETRERLAEAVAARASASNAVASKEKEKRWLKF